MNSVAARLRADFEASSVMAHAGGKGAARERIIHSFIEPYLPQNLKAFGSAEIISVSGDRSGQCDIVIADCKVPPLLDLENHRILVCEGVYVVIEVKSTLTKPHLETACRTIARVKRLQKAAREASDATPYVHTVGMVLSFSGPQLETIGDNLQRLSIEHGPEALPDSIYVLGKGLFNTERREGQSILRAIEVMDNDITLALLTRLNAHYNRATMPLLNLDYYAGDAIVGRYLRGWRLGRADFT